MKELQEEIKKKEIEVRKTNHKRKEMIELRILQEQLNRQIYKEIERKSKLLKQKEFEGANKPGRFLVWQIKQRKPKNYIYKIKGKGREMSDQKGI